MFIFLSILFSSLPVYADFSAQERHEKAILKNVSDITRAGNTLRVKTQKGEVVFTNGEVEKNLEWSQERQYFLNDYDKKRQIARVELITSYETNETYMVFMKSGQKILLEFGDSPVFSPNGRQFIENHFDLVAQYTDTGFTIWEDKKGEWKPAFTTKALEDCGYNVKKWVSDIEISLEKICFPDTDKEKTTSASIKKSGAIWKF